MRWTNGPENPDMPGAPSGCLPAHCAGHLAGRLGSCPTECCRVPRTRRPAECRGGTLSVHRDELQQHARRRPGATTVLGAEQRGCRGQWHRRTPSLGHDLRPLARGRRSRLARCGGAGTLRRRPSGRGGQRLFRWKRAGRVLEHDRGAGQGRHVGRAVGHLAGVRVGRGSGPWGPGKLLRESVLQQRPER